MSEEILRISHVSKRYRLGMIGGTTLRDELQRRRAKRKGLTDPTKRIGSRTANGHSEFMALDDIDLTVCSGERIGIIGHNGAGKSTLLKLICRITAPSAGIIEMNGRIASMLEVGTGFHPELTGRENIYMNGAILGMSKAEIDSKIEEIIDFSECRQFIDTPVKRYSSGMYVKLAFSVAAHLDSEIMIMDEVLAVGDMAFQKKCLDKMNSVSKTEGRTVLYVSHNMNTIRQLCNRCIVLNHGRIIYDGDVENAIEKYIGSIGELQTTYEYEENDHNYGESRNIEILSLHVLDVTDTRIQQGTPLNFVMRCRFHEDCSKANIRFEIMTAGQVSGTAFLEKTVAARKGEIAEILLCLNTENFAPSKYSAAALVFESNEYGGQSFYDRVEPALVFEIVNEKENAISWLSQYWGYTRYDDLKIKEVRYIQE